MSFTTKRADSRPADVPSGRPASTARCWCGCRSVSKRVRGKPRALIDLIEKSLLRVRDRAHRDALATVTQKERGAVARCTNRAQQLVTLRFVVSQRELRVVTN